MQTHGEASAGSAGHRPARLMQRLAQAGLTAEPAEVGKRPRRAGAGSFFALGLIGGALVGGVALIAFQPRVPARLHAVGENVGAFTASLAPWNWPSLAEPAPTAPSKPVVAKQDQPDVFDVTIDRSARAHAAFGLRLVGAQDQSLQVLMRDVPAGAVLSHGERRDASTWAVQAADLEHLHLALDDATPDAFDLRIDVVASSGVAAGSSVAHVRLVAAPPPGETAVLAFEGTPPEAAPPMAEAAPDLQPPKAPVATPSRNRVRDDKGKTATVPSAPVAGQRHWPEGASGLGAVSQSSERQVWWKLPQPSWSPFPSAITNQP